MATGAHGNGERPRAGDAELISGQIDNKTIGRKELALLLVSGDWSRSWRTGMVKESWKRKALAEASAEKAGEALGSTEISMCLGRSTEMEK